MKNLSISIAGHRRPNQSLEEILSTIVDVLNHIGVEVIYIRGEGDGSFASLMPKEAGCETGGTQESKTTA